MFDPLRYLWRRGKRALFAVQRLRYHRIEQVEALGLRWTLDLRDGLQRELAADGDYEPEVRNVLLSALRPGDVLLDVGGNIGVLCLPIALERPDVRVVAFEPMPATAAKFRATAASAGLSNVTLIETAVGSSAGVLHLKKDPWFGNSDTGVVSAYGIGRLAQAVPVGRLDDLLVEHAIERADVIKMDIEGGEHQALLGMGGILRDLRPRVIVVEIQKALLDRAGVEEGAIETLLADAGYHVSQMIDRNVVFTRH